MAKQKEKKNDAPQQSPTPPNVPDKNERLQAALCYLSILILLPAAGRYRKVDFVRFHLNQGIILLALATVCGVVALVPPLQQIGTTLTILVDVLSFIGLVCALRGQKMQLPFVGTIGKYFHPF